MTYSFVLFKGIWS